MGADDRERGFCGTSGFVLWFTGLPASGKTTLAHAVQKSLAQRSIQCVLIDSDQLRSILTARPTYSTEERDWFYGVIGWLAAWLAQSGVNVLIAATANRAIYRQNARAQIERFAEVYVRCSLATCRSRDPKGIYWQAQSGSAAQVPGMGVEYEPPPQPEAVIDTDQLTPAAAAEAVIAQLSPMFQKTIQALTADCADFTD